MAMSRTSIEETLSHNLLSGGKRDLAGRAFSRPANLRITRVLT